IGSLLLHRDPGNGSSEYLRGAQFWISVPASVGMQLDGSPVKLKGSLSASDGAALQQAGDPDVVVVTYRFDAMPRALRVAIPNTYDDALFENGPDKEKAPALEHQHSDQDAPRAGVRGSWQEQHLAAEQIDALLETG